MQDVAITAGASAAVACNGFTEGGDGAVGLAEAVVRATTAQPPPITYLYPLDAPIREKVRALATKVYGAADVKWSPEASRKLARFEEQGLGSLPVCMAKTPLSSPMTLRSRTGPAVTPLRYRTFGHRLARGSSTPSQAPS